MIQTDTTQENWFEMAILCNMIVSEEICENATTLVREDFFQDERNRILFCTLQRIRPSGNETRFEALARLLRSDGLLERVGGKAYVYCVYLYVPVGDVNEFTRLLIRRAA